MFRFLLGVFVGMAIGAFGMAYLWWQDEQERAEAGSPGRPEQQA